MYRTAFPQTPSSYMLLCISIPISADLKGEKNALLSVHSFCLINWRLSQVFLHAITVSFPEEKKKTLMDVELLVCGTTAKK